MSFDGIKAVSPVSKHLLERLAAEVPADTILDGIRKLLAATFVTKSGKEHPDYRAREAGLKLWLNYLVGLPVQRQVIANVPPPKSREESWHEIERSPAARAALRRVLDDADRRAEVGEGARLPP